MKMTLCDPQESRKATESYRPLAMILEKRNQVENSMWRQTRGQRQSTCVVGWRECRFSWPSNRMKTLVAFARIILWLSRDETIIREVQSDQDAVALSQYYPEPKLAVLHSTRTPTLARSTTGIKPVISRYRLLLRTYRCSESLSRFLCLLWRGNP